MALKNKAGNESVRKFRSTILGRRRSKATGRSSPLAAA